MKLQGKDTIKEMNLQELINYIYDNKITNETFISKYSEEIRVNSSGDISSTDLSVLKDEKFEVQEKVNEHTIFDVLIEVLNDGTIVTHHNECISEEKFRSSKSFSVLNVEGDLVQIWKDGEMTI